MTAMARAASLQRVAPPLDDAARGPRVFAGEVVHFAATPQAEALVALARARVSAAFPDAEDPQTAQHTVPDAEFLRRARAVTEDFRRDPQAAAVFARLLVALGCDPATTWVDAFHLRIQPSGIGREDRRAKPLHAHRDTWGSNRPQQVNWWLPATPLAPGRTLALFPDYWDRPLANDSADWDWEALKAARRQAKAAGRDPDAAYPTLPRPLEAPDPATGVPLLPAVGEVVAFSGAHLHASVPNDTGVTRLSLETRTLWQGDLDAGRGAPNVDGAAPRVPEGWFRPLAPFLRERAER